MATYRYGRYTRYGWCDGVNGKELCYIEKKTFFGWKTFDYWNNDTKGNEKMKETIDSLKQAGNIVYPY